MRASYTGIRDPWLPRTVLEADFLVSMPKIKTHHWAGVTLSMKNMFGIVSRGKVRMAEEYSLLEGHSGEHSRFVRYCSDPLRYRRWDRGDARERFSKRFSSTSGQDCAGR